MPPSARLIADIGGTNARFALCDEQGRPTQSQTLRTAEHPDLTAAAHRYLEERDAAVSDAVIAVAGPILGDRVELTNAGTGFSQSELRRALGLSSLRVINDLAALALGVTQLKPSEVMSIGPEVVPDPAAPIVVIGVGTGLGVAALIPSPGGPVPVTTEGGHADFAPNDPVEAALLELLRTRLGHLSWERLVSGPGLELLHDALAELDGRSPPGRSAARIAESARSGEPHGRATVERMFALLASFAGNLALSYGAFGGVYLAGGVLASLASLLPAERFAERFRAKGRFTPYLARVPLNRVLRDDTALLGAAALPPE